MKTSFASGMLMAALLSACGGGSDKGGTAAPLASSTTSNSAGATLTGSGVVVTSTNSSANGIIVAGTTTVQPTTISTSDIGFNSFSHVNILGDNEVLTLHSDLATGGPDIQVSGKSTTITLTRGAFGEVELSGANNNLTVAPNATLSKLTVTGESNTISLPIGSSITVSGAAPATTTIVYH